MSNSLGIPPEMMRPTNPSHAEQERNLLLNFDMALATKEPHMNWVDELNERSKDDRAFIAGSEVRALVAELRTVQNALRNVMLYTMKMKELREGVHGEHILRFCREGNCGPSILRNSNPILVPCWLTTTCSLKAGHGGECVPMSTL